MSLKRSMGQAHYKLGEHAASVGSFKKAMAARQGHDKAAACLARAYLQLAIALKQQVSVTL